MALLDVVDKQLGQGMTHTRRCKLMRYFNSGSPGDPIDIRWSFAVMRVLSASDCAADRRLRSFAIFSLRVRRRRISGRRLGADINLSPEMRVLALMSGSRTSKPNCTPTVPCKL